ncbi:conserved protein of unknown function [Nocardia cyriacigeorgica GUH-2]|uniref:Uncharacterized protein n=1 Tax=Nocardia cyriacigeorgica (strain GUH-2) TaxID=1127134 RepID=H6R3P9_NOCCG|nr:conserved protein of unknown function [Nocardia cyriacigeorgica GUH-2]
MKLSHRDGPRVFEGLALEHPIRRENLSPPGGFGGIAPGKPNPDPSGFERGAAPFTWITRFVCCFRYCTVDA